MQIILAIDCHEEHLREWEKALSSCYKIVTAKSISEALGLLKDILPDMIICELDMPDMSAIELMEQIQQNIEWNRIPVVISSGRFDVEMERICFQKGAIEYLHYPIDGEVLLSRIRHSLDVQRTRQRLEVEVLRKSLEIERKNAEMEKQRFIVESTSYDNLTGVLNRTVAMSRINACLEKCCSGAFFILDMDNFKAVNDTYGHMEGDRLLVTFARTLERQVGDDAIISRIGGDEFIVFLGTDLQKKELQKVASNIVRKVEKEILSPGKLVKVTVSVGIASAPGDGRSFDELYSKADKALYYVKKEGKNAYHFFGEGNTKRAKKRTCVSLSDIKRNMGEENIMNGSYMVDYNSFEKIYRFIERNMKREPRQVQCVLFTYHDIEECMDEEVCLTEMEQLGEIVARSLRKGDVSAYYSATQLLVLLMDTDVENATTVVERIMNQYYDENNVEEDSISFEIQTVSGQVNEMTEVV